MRTRTLAALAAALAVGGGSTVVLRPEPAASTGPLVHVVGRGETVSHVADRYDVTVPQLVRANARVLRDPDRVTAGTKLVVPGRAVPKGRAAASQRRSALPSRLLSSPQRLALRPHFARWTRAYGVPTDLLEAMCWQESGWQPGKVSHARAIGVGQLTPETVDFVNDVLLRGADLDPRVPEQNIRLSARFLRYLLDRTPDTPTAVAAYFQGLASVRRSGPSPAARTYVANVLALRTRFASGPG